MFIDEGILVVCEIDIYGVIFCLLIEVVNLGRNKSFFVDWIVRYLDNENGELL